MATYVGRYVTTNVLLKGVGIHECMFKGVFIQSCVSCKVKLKSEGVALGPSVTTYMDRLYVHDYINTLI